MIKRRGINAVGVAVALLLLPLLPADATASTSSVLTSTTGTQLVEEDLLAGRWTMSGDGRTAALVVEGRSDIETASRYRARWLSGWLSSNNAKPTSASFTQCSSLYGSMQGNMLQRVRLRIQDRGRAWSAWTDLYGGYPGRARRYKLEPAYRNTQESGTGAAGGGRLVRVEVEASGVVSDRIDDVGLGLAVSVPAYNPTTYFPGCPLSRQ